MKSRSWELRIIAFPSRSTKSGRKESIVNVDTGVGSVGGGVVGVLAVGVLGVMGEDVCVLSVVCVGVLGVLVGAGAGVVVCVVPAGNVEAPARNFQFKIVTWTVSFSGLPAKKPAYTVSVELK